MSTQQAMAALATHNLIVPWELSIQTDEGNRQITGLYRIDEAALNQLSGEALAEVIKAHQKVKAPQPSSLPVSPSGDLNLDALDFSNFK